MLLQVKIMGIAKVNVCFCFHFYFHDNPLFYFIFWMVGTFQPEPQLCTSWHCLPLKALWDHLASHKKILVSESSVKTLFICFHTRSSCSMYPLLTTKEQLNLYCCVLYLVSLLGKKNIEKHHLYCHTNLPHPLFISHRVVPYITVINWYIGNIKLNVLSLTISWVENGSVT